MARKSLIAALVLMLMFSMGVFAFPYISNAVYNRNKLQTKVYYEQQSSSLSQEEINQRIEEARLYNQQLIDSGVVLTEPFDPIQENLDEKYFSMLNDTEEMGYISIPSLDLNLPIYHSTDEEVLEKGVGHLYHTSLPVGGQSTNCVLSAHCGLPNAELFTHLDKLKNGNTFTIQVYNETYTYEVYDKAVVDPEDVSSLYIQPGKDIVTLITCTPYGVNTHRLLVFGKRVKDKDVESVLKQEPEINDSIEPQDILNIAFIFVCNLFFIIFLVLFIKRR